MFWQFQFANYTSRNYEHTGKGSLRLQLINQREDFSFALFSGGLLNVCTKCSFLLVNLLNFSVSKLRPFHYEPN